MSFSFSFSATEDDWQRLASLLSKNHLTEIVKRDKHLQQHEFSGFRPTHLPWQRASNTIAKHAQSCSLTRAALIEMGLITPHSLLLSRVKEEISIDTIEDNVTRLLGSIGCTEKEQNLLLWALLLDGREEIQQALGNGLHDNLLDASSALVLKAKLYKLEYQLQENMQEFNAIRDERDNLKPQVEQIPLLQSTIKQMQEDIANIQGQLTQERLLHNDALRCLENEYNAQNENLIAAQNEANNLQKALTEERGKTQALEDSLTQLVQEREALGAQVQLLEDRLAQARTEICVLLDKRQEIRIPESLLRLDAAWKNATRDLSNHLHATLVEQPLKHHIGITTTEKINDWEYWQQKEFTLVRSILSSSPQFLTPLDLSNIENVQQLLVLRWYLLEWLERSILEMLTANNNALTQKMEESK